MNNQEPTQQPVVQNDAPSQGTPQFFGIDLRSTRITMDDIVSDAEALVDIWHVKPDYAKPLLIAEKGKELSPAQKQVVGVYISLGQLYI